MRLTDSSSCNADCRERRVKYLSDQATTACPTWHKRETGDRVQQNPQGRYSNLGPDYGTPQSITQPGRNGNTEERKVDIPE